MKTASIIKPLLLGLTLLFSLTSCTSIPDGITPVKQFELKKYLGKWYEIARLDHPFERGLSDITATYSLREDGGVSVLNRGFSTEKGDWQEAQGKAYFVDKTDEGYLKVSFFGPFYGSYIIFELDKNYQYAFIAGPNKDYLWLLSRTPTIAEDIKQKFMLIAKDKGYDTSSLIFPEQKMN